MERGSSTSDLKDIKKISKCIQIVGDGKLGEPNDEEDVVEKPDDQTLFKALLHLSNKLKQFYKIKLHQ